MGDLSDLTNEINEISHVLFRSNGESITTRLALVEKSIDDLADKFSTVESSQARLQNSLTMLVGEVSSLTKSSTQLQRSLVKSSSEMLKTFTDLIADSSKGDRKLRKTNFKAVIAMVTAAVAALAAFLK